MKTETSVPTPWRRVRPLWRTVALTVATFNLYWFWWFWATWGELKQEIKDDRMRPFGHLLSLFVPIYQLFRIHAHFRAIKNLGVQHSGVEKAGLVALSPGVALLLALVGGFLIRLSADLSVEPVYAGSPWLGSTLLILGTLVGFHASLGGSLEGSLSLQAGFDIEIGGSHLYIGFPYQFSLSVGLSLMIFLVSIGVFAFLISSAQRTLNSLWLRTTGRVTTGTRWYHWIVLALGALTWYTLLSSLPYSPPVPLGTAFIPG